MHLKRHYPPTSIPCHCVRARKLGIHDFIENCAATQNQCIEQTPVDLIALLSVVFHQASAFVCFTLCQAYSISAGNRPHPYGDFTMSLNDSSQCQAADCHRDHCRMWHVWCTISFRPQPICTCTVVAALHEPQLRALLWPWSLPRSQLASPPFARWAQVQHIF